MTAETDERNFQQIQYLLKNHDEKRMYTDPITLRMERIAVTKP